MSYIILVVEVVVLVLLLVLLLLSLFLQNTFFKSPLFSIYANLGWLSFVSTQICNENRGANVLG